MELIHPSVIAVVIATTVSFVLGGVLHGYLFRNIAVGKSKQRKPEGSVMILAVVGTFLMSYGLGLVGKSVGAIGAAEGACIGLIMWLLFVTPLQITVKFTNDLSWKTYGVNTLCMLITFVVNGALLASW